MDIGKKIKELRTVHLLTQEELANRCDLTKGYISQLENNLTSPSIQTLIEILEVLGTNPQEFFKDDSDKKIIFNKDDYVLKKMPGYDITWLITNAQKNHMEPVIVEIEGKSKTVEDFPHEGEEFGYVLKGEVLIHYDKSVQKMKKGESFYFTADKVHYLSNPGEESAEVIWISSPPNF